VIENLHHFRDVKRGIFAIEGSIVELKRERWSLAIALNRNGQLKSC
jgi:hypothetical protein